MSIRNIAVCSALLGVSYPLMGEARLNSPLDLVPGAWTPVIDDLLMAYITPQAASVDGEEPSTSTTTMSPKDFSRNLLETVYLSKLLFAAEHGAHIPKQNKKPTNPIDLLNSIPFPFNLFSEGFKRAAAAAGIDLDVYKKSIEESYQQKVASMIQHGIIDPDTVARAVQELEPQAFLSIIPAFDQEYLVSLRSLLPQNLAEIPSVDEVMRAFNVEQGSPAEQTLRTLFPFFNADMLSQFMRMAAQGIPIREFLPLETVPETEETEAEMREDEVMPGVQMWIPFLDTNIMRQYVEGFMGQASLSGLSLDAPLQYMQDNLAKFIPFSLPA